MEDLQVGDKVQVLSVEGTNEAAHLGGTLSSAEVLGWASRDEKQKLMYLDIAIQGKHVRLTRDHYVIVKRTLDSEQNVLKAEDVRIGYHLPVQGPQRLEWYPVTDRITLNDTGVYLPLLSKSGNIVTRHGIVVPLLSHGHDQFTKEESSDLTPAEAYTVYSSWVRDYMSLKSKYPCLVTFDKAYKQTVVTEMMKQYFAQHKHDVTDAIEPERFFEWLRSDPETVVGSEYAPHLRQVCPDLF